MTTADRHIDRPTDRQTDIATYRAAIAAKNIDTLSYLKLNKTPIHNVLALVYCKILFRN